MELCATTPASPGDAASRRRGIGPLGTAARIIVGLVLLVGVIDRAAGWVGIFGSSSAGLRPAAWALGLVGLPAGLLVWQWLRARRNPAPLRALGPTGFVLNTTVIVALLLTPWYAPPLAITFETALIFYGASMLLAAVRGYGGCEVLAVSNWLLRRDDQVGCLLFAPFDYAERTRRDGRGGDGGDISKRGWRSARRTTCSPPSTGFKRIGPRGTSSRAGGPKRRTTPAAPRRAGN